ncbi:MAG: recombinase family protein [bacterium]
MKTDKSTIKYFAYVRKSTEGEEKQALSIPAQKDKLKELFSDLDIEFVEDKASAFHPYNRPAFADMLERIRKGERQGLLAWHPDRLSRNEVDASTITYMLREGLIKDLKLVTYHFENNSPEGIWMLQMALSQSQYESAKKGRDVKRGLEQKANMGVYPAPAPLGYINDRYAEKGYKTIHPDPVRFDLVRKMFDLMLTGNYSPARIQIIADKEWRFLGQRGKKISRSTVYSVFTMPFYYGEFEYPRGSGNWHKGIHKTMITREEYERIQALLGRPSQQRPKKHDFAYRGPIRCGECGAMVTAETKTKRLKDGGVQYYTYYHCTKRRDPNCSQKSLEEKEIEKQVTTELDKLEIKPDFRQWALARLREMNAHEVGDRERIYGNQRREYEGCVKKLDNLIDMRADEEIDAEEFKNRKTALFAEKERLHSLLKDTDRRIENWLEIAERGFNFAERAQLAFEKGGLEVKKKIFADLGSNFILQDGKLNVSVDILLFAIDKLNKGVELNPAMLEPAKTSVDSTRSAHFLDGSCALLRGQDSNLRPSGYT